MDLKHTGKTIIAVVAQRPFASGVNSFCKLIPLFNHLDPYDKELKESDFYNDGEIWWMLSPRTTARSVIPGTLREISLEAAKQNSGDEAGRSLYQVQMGTGEDVLGPQSGAEVYMLSGETEKSLLRFKDNSATIKLSHVPSKVVFFRVGTYVYGPFNTQLQELPYAGMEATVKLQPVFPTKIIYKISAANFREKYHALQATRYVSWDAHSARCKGVGIEYLPPNEVEKITADYGSCWSEMDFESLSAKIARVVRSVEGFSRSDKQQLKALMGKLENALTLADNPQDLQKSLKDVGDLTDSEEQTVKDLAQVLMDNKILDEKRIKEAEDAYLQEWIKTQGQSINEQLEKKRGELVELNQQYKAEVAQFELERQRRVKDAQIEKARVKDDLEKEKNAAREAIAGERASWDADQAARSKALQAQQDQITALLEELKLGSEKNASNIIALYPFLKELAVVPVRGSAASSAKDMESEPALPRASTFEIPHILLSGLAHAESASTQQDFLRTLTKFLEAKGLSYDPDDLRRFHTSVLCEGLTVLEGPSGVGKSSLARLYGAVLAGRDAQSPRDGTHVVHVSPSWVERADILGFVNTVTGEYSPSETGLYQRLLYAEADYRANKGDAAMYPICLDEMNLAQVEHYFGDFLQILELPEEDRILPCFSQEAVSPKAIFRDYPRLRLSPGVKFIGTVNFDETTRRLSARLLDRVNLIYLNDPGLDSVRDERADPDAGAGVSCATYTSWLKEGNLSQTVRKCLDDLADPLRQLGVVVSPRVRNAMSRYIASSAPLIESADRESRLLNEQIAQRVLSKVRTITSLRQDEALDNVSRILSDLSGSDKTPAQRLIDRLRSVESFHSFEDDED